MQLPAEREEETMNEILWISGKKTRKEIGRGILDGVLD